MLGRLLSKKTSSEVELGALERFPIPFILSCSFLAASEFYTLSDSFFGTGCPFCFSASNWGLEFGDLSIS